MKYKLIVDLPNLKAGEIVEFDSNSSLGGRYYAHTTPLSFTKEEVENQPQFFLKVEDNLYQKFLEKYYNIFGKNNAYQLFRICANFGIMSICLTDVDKKIHQEAIQKAINYLDTIQTNFTIEEFKHPINGNVYRRNYNGTYGFNLHIPFDICAARYLINKISFGKDNLPLRIGTKCKLITGQEVTIESFLLVNNIPKIMTKNSSHFLTEIGHIWQEEKTPKQEYITLPNKVKIPITKGLQITITF